MDLNAISLADIGLMVDVVTVIIRVRSYLLTLFRWHLVQALVCCLGILGRFNNNTKY